MDKILELVIAVPAEYIGPGKMFVLMMVLSIVLPIWLPSLLVLLPFTIVLAAIFLSFWLTDRRPDHGH